MIDALIAGRVYGTPAERTSKTGKPFAVAKVRAAAGDGESIFVNVVAFDQAPCKALLARAEGDSVALSGSLTPKVWTDREGNTRPSLDLVAHQVLTSYHVTRKRNATAQAQPQQRPRHDAWQAMAPGPDMEPLDF